MHLDLPRELFLGWWTLVGLFVGSFLNVCVHRLPLEGETVARPRRSKCPSCSRTLTWRENVPLVSWVLQHGRCKGCGWRIPWRYPLIEALTAGLFLWAALHTPADRTLLLVARVVVMAGLVVATFVDFERFEIPDEVSLGGMALAPLASLLVPELHAASPLPGFLGLVGPEGVAGAGEPTRLGALATCLAGELAGGGVLLGVGWIGRRAFGRDAMGLGDVKLLAAGGGFVGPGAVFVALMLGSVVASAVGVGNMLRYLCLVGRRSARRGKRAPFGHKLAVARIAARYVPFGPYLALGLGIVLLHWNDVARWLE